MPGEWIATPPDVPGLQLWEFTWIKASDPAHPQIAALAYKIDSAKPEDYLVRVDVATGKELSRLQIALGDVDGAVFLKSSTRALVLGIQQKTGFELEWIDLDAQHILERRSFPGLGVGTKRKARGFAVFDDRIILATADFDSLTLRLLDEKGNQLWANTCHGGIGNPGRPGFVRVEDEAIVDNLSLSLSESVTNWPICAFSLHGPPRWREALLPGPSAVYTDDGGRPAVVTNDGERLLTPDLRVGARVRTSEPPHQQTREEYAKTVCWSADGGETPFYAVIGEYRIVKVDPCCGEDGVFLICRPPPEATGAGGTPP
jgi:hypothetical protein